MSQTDLNPMMTPARAVATVQTLMAETRDMLSKVLLEEFKAQSGEMTRSETDKTYSIFTHFPQPTSDIGKSQLTGFCSHAQSFLAWTLQDRGYAPGCFIFEARN